MDKIRITKDFKDFELFDALMESSFPKNELLGVRPSKIAEMGDFCQYAYYDDGEPVGLLITISGDDYIYLMFVAVFSHHHGKGYGSAIINDLTEENSDKLIFCEAEAPDESADNNDQRLARIKFYEKLGFTYTDVPVNIAGVDFVILEKGSGADSKEQAVRTYSRFIEKQFESMNEAGLPIADCPYVILEGKTYWR